MATDKTKLTELGTAVGLCFDPSAPWPAAVERLAIPGVPAEVWQPVVLPVTATAHPARALLQRAMGNGQAFRSAVLRGRRPERIEWSSGTRAAWASDVPRNLTIDGVYFVEARYDATCVVNTAPATVFDHLLIDDGAGHRTSWYETVALGALQEFYARVRGQSPFNLPRDVRDLETSHRAQLKAWMRVTPPVSAEDAAYADLCHAVSVETAWRWEHRLRGSTAAQRTQMLLRMLRIAGGPHWVLGTKGTHPVRLAVTDARTWRDRFTLRQFSVVAAQAGQPQVDWRAVVVDNATKVTRPVEGYCEVRWSHGKLQGNPECKVQVTTPLDQLPGYDPVA